MYKSYSFKIISFCGLFVAGLFITENTFGQSTNSKTTSATNNTSVSTRAKWQVNPLDHQIFVQNNSQFDGEANSSDKILFQAKLGDAKAYFTAHGVIYRYDKYLDNSPKGLEKPVTQYLPVEWENASPNVSIDAEEEQEYYYTYPTGESGFIKALVYKKIIYRNIYPGIDIEYSFPKDKDGIKYNIVLHPGADLSLVKLKYAGAQSAHIDKEGNVVVKTSIGEFTDHAPVSFYKKGGSIAISYSLKGTVESFTESKIYNQSATVVIDPWTTNPIFTAAYNKAYDIDYDDKGNVYAYGGYNPFQLVKIDSIGKIKWTFNASTIDGLIYGDFAVDKFTGTSYILESAHATGARALKVNTLGALKATFPGDTNVLEMWRAVINPCNHTLVIGAGDNNHIYQACTLDTNMTKLTYVNVLGASAPGHGMVFTAIDPLGDTCYMATAKAAAVDTAKFKNVLLKMALPSLSPTSYIVPDGYKFVELASVNYAGPGIGTTNGMNGLAVSRNWLYMSDGSSLEKVNKTTGAIVSSILISGTSFAWGGLDVDVCDNLYAGNNTSINVYNSALALKSTIKLPGVVYDVVLGPNEKILYAAGRAFVSSFNVSTALSISKTVTSASCACNGSAKVSLSSCGKIDSTSLSYVWSNGQTTQTATNLCAATYSVSILYGCSAIFSDTVVISPHFITVNNPSPVICAGANGISLTASGGQTYTWQPATGLSSTNNAVVTANPLITTTYTVVGVTGTGCKDSSVIIVKVNPKPNVVISGPAIPVCPFTPINLSASGATSYFWSPGASLNCDSCSNVISTISASGGVITYKVIGTLGGCTDTTKVTVRAYTIPTIKIVTTPTACDSFNGTATATVSGSEPYTYSWSPKGGSTTAATGLAAGTYTITVTDTNGCTTMQTGTVNVTASPTVTATSAVATCDSTNGKAIASVTGGTPPYSYFWSPSGGNTSIAKGLGAGIYKVFISDKNGCVATAITIIEDTGATIAFSARNNVSCFGGSDGGATVVMTGGTNPYTYTWSPLGETTASVNNLTIGQFTVVVSDIHNCTLIDTININQPTVLVGQITPANIVNANCFGGSNGAMSVIASGGVPSYTYNWSNGETGDTATGLQANSYTVTIKDKNGCTVTTSDVVGQPLAIAAVAGNSSATCGNNGTADVVVVGGTPAYTYSWSGGAGNGATVYNLGKGTYTVTVTDANGCKDTVSTYVDTIGQTATIKASTNVLCFGGNNGSATVSVIGGDTSLYGYNWSPIGGNNATGIGLTAGFYTVTVTYIADGCQVKVNDTITQPPALISKVTDSLECSNIVIATDSTKGGVPPYLYNWNPVGGNASVATITSGSYTLTVTDAHGCVNTVTLIAPFTDPIANFSAIPDTIASGDSVEFVNLSTGGGASNWWTFGDGGNSADSMPYHIYNFGGTYDVTLYISNSLGCKDSITESIFVKEGVIAPNVFTPNGDGINDVFHVNAFGLSNYKIDIYDRWGLLIFEGTGPNNDWTGRTMAGELVSAGTYYYIITASDNKGKPFNTKGYLTLIR